MSSTVAKFKFEEDDEDNAKGRGEETVEVKLDESEEFFPVSLLIVSVSLFFDSSNDFNNNVKFNNGIRIFAKVFEDKTYRTFQSQSVQSVSHN